MESLAAEKKQAMLDRLAKQIARGDLEPSDVADMRGFIRGMDAVLNAPRNALRELDRIGDKTS